MNKLTEIKHRIARYLLADEVAKVDLERNTFLTLQATLKRNMLDFEKMKEKVTLTDMVREKMQSFNPKLLNDDNDLPEILGDVEAQDPFLAKMKSLKNTKELWVLVDYLYRNLCLQAVINAENAENINFSRASINGLALLKEEVERLSTVYEDRHKHEPDFDEHEVV